VFLFLATVLFLFIAKKKKNGVIKNKRYRNALRLRGMTEGYFLLEKL